MNEAGRENKGDVTIVIAPQRDSRMATEKLLRQMPVQGSTDTMRLPPSPRQAGLEEDTELYVLAGGVARLERLAPQVDRVFLGGGAVADVSIPDNGSSEIQMAIWREPNGWWFADRGVEDRCSFDGVTTVQHATTSVARTIVGIGDVWMVFCGACGHTSTVRSGEWPVRDADREGPHLEVRAIAGWWLGAGARRC